MQKQKKNTGSGNTMWDQGIHSEEDGMGDADVLDEVERLATVAVEK